MIRVALLDPPASFDAPGVALHVLAPRAALLDAALRVRKLGDGLGSAAAAALALRRGRFDVAHAFTPEGALAATWANGRASALTFTEPLRRERLADRRLRLATLERAVARSGAVLAADDEVRGSLERWLGVEARVLDAEGHAALYAELLRATSSRMSLQRPA
ncbi:MAG: hypothetical protein QOE60_2826 [Thermoleophilaceae bacterium]|nr:hypothetical protein [Thermoleophilaceae bacterium]